MLGAVIQHEKNYWCGKKVILVHQKKICSVPEAKHFYLFNLYFFKILTTKHL